jgi:hypothetical protein
VQTKVDSTRLSLLAGELKVKDLSIANPTGYTEPHFMTIGKSEAALTINSITKEVIEVPYIRLDNLTLSLEKKGEQANYDVILANIKDFQTKIAEKVGSGSQTTSTTEAEKSAGGSKRIIIREITITDVKVDATVRPLGGIIGNQNVRIVIPQIQLKDVGSDSDKAVLVDQVSGVIVAAILKSIVEQAGGQLPGEIGKGLATGVNALGDIGVQSIKVIGNVGKGVVEGVGGAVNEVGKGVGGAVNEVGKGIGSIFGGDKKKTEEEK